MEAVGRKNVVAKLAAAISRPLVAAADVCTATEPEGTLP